MQYLGYIIIGFIIFIGICAVATYFASKGIDKANDAMDDSFRWGGRAGEDE